MQQNSVVTPGTTGGSCAGRPLVVRNSLLNLTSRLLNAVVNLVTVYVLAHRLSKDEFGLYYTVFALLLAVQMIVESGIATVVTYRIVRSPDRWKRTVAEANGLLLCVVTVSFLALTAIGFAWRGWSGGSVPLALFVLTGIAVAMIQVQRFATAVFRAFESFGWENLTLVMQGALFAGLAWLLLGAEHGTTTVMAMFAASHAAAAVVLVIALQSRRRCLEVRFGLTILRSWLSQSVPLGIGDVIRRLTWQLDTILLGLLQPASVVAVYAIGYWPLAPLNWVPIAIMTATFPSLARIGTLDRESLSRMFTNSIRCLWLISLPIAVVIFVAAGAIVRTIAGPDYEAATEPMRILIWITILSFLSVQWRFFLTAVASQRAYGRLVFGVFAIELLIELLLIPIWGYFGACAGSLVGEVVFVVAGIVLCRRLGFGHIEWRPVIGGACSALGMGAFLWMFRDSSLPVLVLNSALATVLYVALCVATGAICRQDLRAVSRLFRRRRAPAVGVASGGGSS